MHCVGGDVLTIDHRGVCYALSVDILI